MPHGQQDRQQYWQLLPSLSLVWQGHLLTATTWGSVELMGHQAACRNGTPFLTKQPSWKAETRGKKGTGDSTKTPLNTSTRAEAALWGLSCRNTTVAVTIQL